MVLLVLGIANTLHAQATAKPDRRASGEKALTAKDFLGVAPPSTNGMAFTSTELRYDYDYRYRVSGENTTATLTRITIESYVRRDLSWNRKPDDAALLDHEQGHADNSLIECLKARQDFAARMKRGFSVTGGSSKEATSAIEREVRKVMSGYEQAVRDQDALYDSSTSNGVTVAKQQEWRRVQKETLKRLQPER